MPDLQRRWPSMMVVNNKKKKKMVLLDGSGSIYSSRIYTDIPLYESPGASFDRYLEDKPRVFRAIFPDTQRSQRLNEASLSTFSLFFPCSFNSPFGTLILLGREEWRIHMLPVQFLFLTVLPVVDMRLRYKSDGRDYPDGVPPDITKVLELDIIRWELQGLDDIVKPSHFSLGVKGTMYPDRQGKPSLKGQLQMSMSFDVPPVLALVPEKIRRRVTESLLKRLVESMKHKVNGSLLADYSEFKREKLTV